MKGTNVDYYISGFDASGKRVGSSICDFDPAKDKNKGKIDALIERYKEVFTAAEIIEVISAEDYVKYVSGEYIRGADGKPTPYVPPEPSETEKKKMAIAEIKSKYQKQIDALTGARVKAAMLGADTSKIDAKYKAVMTSMSTEIKNA